jgi:hypothetical protein
MYLWGGGEVTKGKHTKANRPNLGESYRNGPLNNEIKLSVFQNSSLCLFNAYLDETSSGEILRPPGEEAVFREVFRYPEIRSTVPKAFFYWELHSIPDWALQMPYIHGLNISYHESNMCCWSEMLWSLSENLMNLIQLYYWFFFFIKIDNWQNYNILITNYASFEPVLQKQFLLTVRERWKQNPVFSSNRRCCTPNMSLVNGFRACAHS